MAFFVYMMTNKPYGTLYIGHTDNLVERVWQHKNKVVKGFTAKYGLDRLVYYKACETRDAAKLREAQLKKWKRDWKIDLIEQENPHWQDLAIALDKTELSGG